MTQEQLKSWEQIKKEYKHSLLVFPCGDFYELYHEDADEAGRILNVTVTRQQNGTHICSFPFHALDMYLPRLVRAGWKVSVLDGLQPHIPTTRQTQNNNTTMTRYQALSKQEKHGYDKGVSDCLNIMSDLSDKYENNEAAQAMYCDFLKRVRKLK